MKVVLDVDGLQLGFPINWQASKYDDWSFYRNQFSKQCGGLKAVDALAVSPDGQAFLIEVKDYRLPGTVKPSALADTVARKVLDTLAALLPAALNANDAAEKAIARSLLKCKRLKVVLHMENPRSHQRVVDPADIQQQLRRLLKAVDAHPKVVCIGQMQKLPWTAA